MSLFLTAWEVGMDQLRDFLAVVGRDGVAQGNLRGLLHILIGRRITLSDGTLVSGGMTWRELAAALKRYRWDPATVTELGLDPANLPPRDRERFWYGAITQAQVSTEEAAQAADQLVGPLRALGYEVGPAPGTG